MELIVLSILGSTGFLASELYELFRIDWLRERFAPRFTSRSRQSADKACAF